LKLRSRKIGKRRRILRLFRALIKAIKIFPTVLCIHSMHNVHVISEIAAKGYPNTNIYGLHRKRKINFKSKTVCEIVKVESA
jgi:hypothetical protein